MAFRVEAFQKRTINNQFSTFTDKRVLHLNNYFYVFLVKQFLNCFYFQGLEKMTNLNNSIKL